MNNFMRGTAYLLTSIPLLFTKGLKRFVLLPILFNFALFIGLFFIGYHYLFPYTSFYLDQLPSWLNFLHSMFFVIFILGFFLIFLSMFMVIFNVIAAPFNGLLAEKAQTLFFHATTPPVSFAMIAWRSIKRQGQFLMYFIPRFLLMCLLFFVPFIQPIYPLLWFIFTAWMLSMQYQDLVMDNNLISFQSMRKKTQFKKALLLGFGALINLLSFIPVLNIIIMPAAVIGSVSMFHKEIQGIKKMKRSDSL